MIDLLEYPLVDNHCHAFLPEKEDEGLDQLLNLSFFSIPKLHIENTLLFKRVVQELAKLLECPPDWATVLRKRKEVYSADPSKYIRRLFNQVRIESLLVDQGYPCEEFNGYSVPLTDFTKLIGEEITIRPIFRIEPLLARLFRTSTSFDQLLEEYIAALGNAVKVDRCVAYKSIIAYVFGLRVQKVSEESARKAYESARRTGALTISTTKKDWIANEGAAIRDEKTLRDYLLWVALKKSIELAVPFQLHTGMGDSPFIDVRAVNPLHLLEVITDEQLREAKIVLVHSGYPYVREAGFLANNYPNVYVDLSELIPFASIGVKSCILQLLEMTPVTKLMYGSDGYNAPEICWIGGIIGREGLAGALQDLLDARAINEEYAHEVARLVLSENAIRLYKLEE